MKSSNETNTNNSNAFLNLQESNPNKRIGYSLKRVNRPNLKHKYSLIELDNSMNNLNLNNKKSKRMACLPKIWSKFKKNFFLLLTIIFMIYIYYIYIFVRHFLNLVFCSTHFIFVKKRA
jgi:hypothetical protein